MTEYTDKEILAEIIAVVRECAEVAYSMRMNPAEVHSEVKEDTSIVTAIDPLLEERIEQKLVAKLGGSFFGEENGRKEANSKSLFEWIVDPIDGTTNFDKGTKEGGFPDLSTWGISVGLRKEGKPYIGVIYKPQTDELFYAIDGQGAFAETTKFGITYTRKLELSEHFSDSRTILGLGLVNSEIITPTNLEIYQGFKDIVRNSTISATSRSMGAAGMEAVSVACGTYAAYISSVPEDDIAADRVILQEAGAKVTCLAGETGREKYFNFIASHPAIHDELVAAVKLALGPSLEIEGDLKAEEHELQKQL